MKIRLHESELYPLYGWTEENEENYTSEYDDSFEVDQETLDRWAATFNEFYRMQEELGGRARAAQEARNKERSDAEMAVWREQERIRNKEENWAQAEIQQLRNGYAVIIVQPNSDMAGVIEQGQSIRLSSKNTLNIGDIVLARLNSMPFSSQVVIGKITDIERGQRYVIGNSVKDRLGSCGSSRIYGTMVHEQD